MSLSEAEIWRLFLNCFGFLKSPRRSHGLLRRPRRSFGRLKNAHWSFGPLKSPRTFFGPLKIFNLSFYFRSLKNLLLENVVIGLLVL